MSDRFTFDEATHEYRVDGIRYPSVTAILSPLVNLEGIPRDVLERKRDLGSRVHFATQLHDEDDLDEGSVEDDVRPYLQGYRDFMRDSGAKVLLNEHRMFDRSLGVAGTLDRVLLLNGKNVLVDIKTAIATPLSACAQTAAYARMLRGWRIDGRAVLRLRPDGKYRLDMLTGPDDWAVFMAALTLHRYKETHANDR